LPPGLPLLFALAKISVPAPSQAVTVLFGRLELARYKATIKELTRFGERRRGTER
jgi:hypothetical protein